LSLGLKIIKGHNPPFDLSVPRSINPTPFLRQTLPKASTSRMASGLEIAGIVLGMVPILVNLQEKAAGISQSLKRSGNPQDRQQGIRSLFEHCQQIVLLNEILGETGQQFLNSNGASLATRNLLHDCRVRLDEVQHVFLTVFKTLEKFDSDPKAWRKRDVLSAKDALETSRVLQAFRESVILLHNLSSTLVSTYSYSANGLC
jgi:hypothetical protein